MIHIFGKSSANAGPPISAGQRLTDLYLFVVFLGLPLVVHRGYFDITETKYLFFLMVSGPYMLLTLLLWLFGRRAALPFKPAKSLRAPDIGMGLFLLAFVAGSLLSGEPGTFLGLGARYQGVLTALSYALVYACVSRNFHVSRLSFLGLIVGFCLVCVLAVLNDFGLDPLHMVRALPAEQRYQFVSTIGNTNFYSAYVGMLLPLILAGWCFARRRLYSISCGLALLCGFAGMLPSASESFMLALFAGLWLLPLFLMKYPPALRRFLAALIAMAAILAGLRLVMLFVPTAQYLSFSLRVLTHPAALLALSLVSGCLLLLLAKRETPLRGQRLYLLVSLGLLALGIVAVVLRNTVFAAHSFGRVDRFIQLNEDWGTDRGRIWTYCLNAFRSFSPLEKLVGKGPGFLALYDMQHPLFSDAILDTAHNEYLQYLLSIGIAGLAGYCALMAGTVGAALKRAKDSPLALALVTGIAASAAQALVNIAQPATTPILFLLFSLAAGCALRSSVEEPSSPSQATSAKAE